MVSRLPRAPEAPLPALAEFLAPFSVHFAQRPSATSLERYVTGLLTEHPRKNCDTLAQVLPGTSEQRLQYLLTDMAWDHEDLNRQRVRRMLALPTEGDAVLIVDDTGFAKQGARSAGVQRQYSGTLGKTGNCQVAVTCHYAERTLAWPVAARLYLPKRWAEDRDLRRAARVPDDVAFRTKPELALALLDEARGLGVPHGCVTVDADYGDRPSFLNGLEARAERYVVAVAADFTVAVTRTSAPLRADLLLRGVPRRAWVPITWAAGSRGDLRAKGYAVRCYRVDGAGTGARRHVGWLLGQRPTRGQGPSGPRKYFWSNFGAQAALAEMLEYAHRRHWVEQYYEEAKGELGWDQFQGRRYDAFHKNAVTVMLSYSFLVWLEWRERQHVRRRGRKRRRFSPSAGPAAEEYPARPPRRRRLAPPGGAPHPDPPITATPHVSTPALTKQY
ncbi:MAG: IS701 family transposase [Gemmatimonadaceae bacterium]